MADLENEKELALKLKQKKVKQNPMGSIIDEFKDLSIE